MLDFLLKPQIIDDDSAQWIFDSFAWALTNFDANAFVNHSQLILPNDQFFPDKADSPEAMADKMCSRILGYCGMQDWPFVMVAPAQFQAAQPPLLGLSVGERGNKQTKQITTDPNIRLQLSYQAAMLKKPADFIASLANFIAQHALVQSQLSPPGGNDYFNATSEILTIFMGFGVLVSNTAYTFRGSCARCYDPRANRTAALSENESVFALALFCQLKNIDNKTAKGSLKSHLRSNYNKAVKQIKRDEARLSALKLALTQLDKNNSNEKITS